MIWFVLYSPRWAKKGATQKLKHLWPKGSQLKTPALRVRVGGIAKLWSSWHATVRTCIQTPNILRFLIVKQSYFEVPHKHRSWPMLLLVQFSFTHLFWSGSRVPSDWLLRCIRFVVGPQLGNISPWDKIIWAASVHQSPGWPMVCLIELVLYGQALPNLI